MNNNINSTRGFRLLGKNHFVSNDPRITQINNNDAIVGSPGSGKSRGYVEPLLATTNESIVVVDCKKALFTKYKRQLTNRGFHVIMLDLVDCDKESCSYNPLEYISYDRNSRRYSEQDIRRIAAILSPTLSTEKDPFWTQSARLVLECMISFVMECTPAHEHHIGSVLKLFESWTPETFNRLFNDLEFRDPDSYALKKYRHFKMLNGANATWSCVRQFCSYALNAFEGEAIGRVMHRRSDFRFSELGNQKTALFLNVSDCDSSQDKVITLFFAQVIQQLMRAADNEPQRRLKVPVRLIFDDFCASGACIPDFDRIISVIRSREISVSIILQSLSQLSGMYGSAKATTILTGCDHILFLGNNDMESVKYFSSLTNRLPQSILNLGLDKCILFERGNTSGALMLDKADIDEMDNYEDVDDTDEIDDFSK